MMAEKPRNPELACPSCAYDLRGSQTARGKYRCPECGYVGTGTAIRLARLDQRRRRSELLDTALMLMVVMALAGVAVAAHRGLGGRWINSTDVFIGLVILVALLYLSIRWFNLSWRGHLLFASVPMLVWMVLQALDVDKGLYVFGTMMVWTAAFSFVVRRMGRR
jgi:hypothetical protein